MDAFKDAFLKGNLFASGLIVNYGFQPHRGQGGQRRDCGRSEAIPRYRPPRRHAIQQLQGPEPSLRAAAHFQEWLKADGRFRVVLFAGNILDPPRRPAWMHFCAKLDAPESNLHTSGGALPQKDGDEERTHRAVEVLTIHSSKRTEARAPPGLPGRAAPFQHPHRLGLQQGLRQR